MEKTEEVTLEGEVYKEGKVAAVYTAKLHQESGWKADVNYSLVAENDTEVKQSPIKVILNGPGESKARSKIANQIYTRL